jgi:hypothetical protein
METSLGQWINKKQVGSETAQCMGRDDTAGKSLDTTVHTISSRLDQGSTASPHTPFAGSHLTSVTYILNHCTISLLIWWHRVTSIDRNLLGPGRPTGLFASAAPCRSCAYVEAEDTDVMQLVRGEPL